jgi:putative phosphoesterase
MRIAIISDIHGNSVALEAVLSDLQTEHIDHVVCLGDIATDGPQPREVIARLKALKSAVVMGNMDAWFQSPHPLGGSSRSAQRGNEIRSWGVSQLSPNDLDYLRTFQVTVEVSLDVATDLLCYHGSPLSNEEGISSTTPDEDLERMLSGCHAAVWAGGHTHTQMVRRHGGTTIFNPGSVGAPSRKGQGRHSPWAEYGIIGWENSSLRIELRRVPVNVNLVKQAALSSGMPHGDWWIKERYGTTG